MARRAPAPDTSHDGGLARLEAISDGIIAIVITIMVLELRPPADPDWRVLLSRWPDFAGYLVSYGVIAIYWVNHRHIIRRASAVGERIVWMNILLLFSLSLVPFATAYIGRTGLAGFPMAIYAGVLMACGASFGALRSAIAAEMADPARRRAFNGPRIQIVGMVTFAMLLAAMGLSLVSPRLALGVIAASSLLHISRLTRTG